ncbi:MAG: T9SS type A sorting domain-containing protein [Flavobacteriales bacterium]|nr:T9SS type A sorting domain-containing protein [Flavobacteriales bacterium]MBK7940857.1 T9SS type A sorting domain-containing protein [Flavobacteriales bacterium]MBK9700722.1 T9SS type A sorting domain-containing protein [Flavobacteriales bacterium]
MKLNHYTAAALLFLPVGVTGQSTFQILRHGAGFAKGHIIELPNGDLLCGHGATGGVSVTDPDGTIQFTRSFAVDSFLVLQSVKPLADVGFLLAGGYRVDTCWVGGPRRIHPVLGRADTLGNIMEASYYVFNEPACFRLAGDLELLASGDVLVHGRPMIGTLNALDNMYLLRLDSMGDVLWAKTYGSEGDGVIEFVRELPGGDLLVGMNRPGAGACMGRMDANGNALWLKSYIRPIAAVKDCVVENDSSFTVVGFTETGMGSTPQLYMLRLDGDGDVQWCKAYTRDLGWPPWRCALDKTPDGQLGVLAVTAGKAYLMKTDQNGDTLWTAAFGIPGYSMEVWNLLAASDGGFVFNGDASGLNSFLFKADSLGHLGCDWLEHHVPVQVQGLFPTDSSFTLATTDGGAVRMPATINDTIYPSFPPEDACIYTPVQTLFSPTHRLPVRPNPTSGALTMVFPDPLRADSFYSVFDGTGRLLFQRPLPSGATSEDIDLSRFGSGTYLLRLSGPEGVYHERVVVAP